MKPIVIIIIAVVCSVVAVFGVLVGVDLITTSPQEKFNQDLMGFCGWSYPTMEPEYQKCLRGQYSMVLFNMWKEKHGNYVEPVVNDVNTANPCREFYREYNLWTYEVTNKFEVPLNTDALSPLQKKQQDEFIKKFESGICEGDKQKGIYTWQKEMLDELKRTGTIQH